MAARKRAQVGVTDKSQSVTALPDRSSPQHGKKPLVFISHDHRDAALAEAFALLLTDSSGGFIKSFRSSDRRGTTGIEFGAEWYKAVMDRLDDATDVVALLTPNSMDRPWILYEAGVAKGKLGTTVFGIALNIPLEQASRGPFAQFQNSDDSEDSLTKLVLQLIERNSDAEPRDEAVRRQVDVFRQAVERLRNEEPGLPQPVPNNDEAIGSGAVAKLFEEVKVMFTELPERLQRQIRETLDSGKHVKRRKRVSLSYLLNRLQAAVTNKNQDDFISQWLLLTSILREEIPSIYESAVEVNKALVSRNGFMMRRAVRQLSAAVHYLDPALFEDLHGHDRGQELYFTVLQLGEVLREYAQRFPGPDSRRVNPSVPPVKHVEEPQAARLS